MNTLRETPANRTRRSRSIPWKLVQQGSLHLLPVYYLLRLSDLAREGIEHSGSFRFADHIYQGQPSGRTPIGRWLDAQLLAMPAARAFRRRYQRAADVIHAAAERHPLTGNPLRVLAVPCGLPRDIVDVSRKLATTNPRALERIEYHGLDIDPHVIDRARAMTFGRGLGATRFHRGNALNARAYPSCRFDLIVSTGLGDFLGDSDLATFYRLVRQALVPGGTFYTSASDRDQRSDMLMRMAELTPQYRNAGDVQRIFRQIGWSRLDVTSDPTGLQSFVIAVK